MALGGCVTDVDAIEVGHATDRQRATGCTVVLCRGGAVGGVEVRGGAPATRETDLLRPGTLVSRVNAVLLAGGSAFGLDAASGVVRHLRHRGIGYRAGDVNVPIVPAAALFDLGIARHGASPTADDGFAACVNASTAPSPQGGIGAGTGATVGKALGAGRAVMGGLGSASARLPDGLVVGAIMAVNAVGGVYDPDDGSLVAGPRDGNGGMVDPMRALLRCEGSDERPPFGTSTTIGVVATNATLSKEQANHLASVSHDGIALAARPAHTLYDGDAMFAMATCSRAGSVDALRMGAAAVDCVARAIVRAARHATGRCGVPAARELRAVSAEAPTLRKANSAAP